MFPFAVPGGHVPWASFAEQRRALRLTEEEEEVLRQAEAAQHAAGHPLLPGSMGVACFACVARCCRPFPDAVEGF